MKGSRIANFLSLSREHPWELAPFSEPLASGGTVSAWDTGVICFEPASPANKDIVISCGIHGNETAPIELCERLLQDLAEGVLTCQHRLLLIFGHPAAMNQGVRELEDNLNRLFSGAHSRGGKQNPERQRAARLEQYVHRFFSQRSTAERLHYDLHTAIRPSKYEKFAIYPYTHGQPYSQQQLAFLRDCEVDTILLAHGPTTTFSYFSAHQFNAHAFTVELGKVMPFGQNDMRRFTAVDRCLRRLVSEPDWTPAPLEPGQIRVFQVCQEVIKYSSAFEFDFGSDVANFTSFSKGSLLARDTDKEWRVEHDLEAVVFPNAKVADGHRAALMVAEVDPGVLTLR